MKRLFLILFLLVLVLVAPPVFAQTWHTANQVTVAWSEVAKIAPTDTIKYQVYTRTDTTSPGQATGPEVTATQLVIGFSVEGRYYFGVETVRYPQGETVGIRSNRKAWSNVATDCSPEGTFGVVYFIAPETTSGLKRLP